LLADRVQAGALHPALHLGVLRAHGRPRPDPLGFALDRGLGVARLDAQHTPSVDRGHRPARVSHGPTLCRGRAGTRVDGGGVREPGALGYRGGPVGRRGGAVPGSRVPLRRVLVHGVTGSGKTTLARRIADVTGLPWHSVDDEIGWLPGWVSRPEVEQRAIAARIAAGDAWVLDTTYSAWRDVVLP